VKVQIFYRTEYLCWGYGTGQWPRAQKTYGNKHFKSQ